MVWEEEGEEVEENFGRPRAVLLVLLLLLLFLARGGVRVLLL